MRLELHDRYSFYNMNGLKVKAKVPKELCLHSKHPMGYSLNGKVSKCFRDVLEGKIHIVVGGRTYVFDEPNYMIPKARGILFIYGHDTMECTDEELFDTLRDIAIAGCNINDAIERTLVQSKKIIHFYIENLK